MSDDKDEFGLTIKQRTYAERVAIDADEEAACVEAGYDTKMLPSLRSHPLIQQAVAALAKARIEKMKMTQEEAEIHLKKMAEPEFSDFYEQDPNTGKFKVRTDIPKEKMAAIKEIREVNGNQVVILHNRETLLDKVLRRHGAYVTKHQISGQIEHKHTHEIDARSLIEEMDQLLQRRDQSKVIDVEAEEVDIPRLGNE